MISLKTYNRQAGRMVVAVALLAATIVSSFLPALAWAAQATERSITMGSSAPSATNVGYQINFKAVGAAGAVAVEFCSNTPLIGEACTKPTGLVITGAASTDPDVTDVDYIDDTDDNTLVIETAITAAESVSLDITGITNPSGVGPMYARIVTYDTKANALLYESEDLGSGDEDQGSVALSITNIVNVSGAVLESMIFCVAKNTISANCDLTGNDLPTLQLGQDIGGGVFALGTTVSTGTINTQISTNAVGGAVVRLKSDAANCGGLKLTGSTDVNNCFISPAGTSGTIAAGDAKFGVMLGTAFPTSGVTDASGTLQAASVSYDTSNYRLNGAADNLSGVTSTYGDAFLNTNSEPVNNQNMVLTFGAQVNNNTPAGLYTADLSLIATGTF